MKTYFSGKRFLCSAALAAGILGHTETQAQPAVQAWVQRYNGPGNGDDQVNAVAVDGSGNVTVTGFSTSSGSNKDYATLKYSSAGLPLWTNLYNGPANWDDHAWAVAVDGAGNVFVAGASFGSGSGYDYATVKYSGAGVPLWTNRYNGPGNGDDWAYALAVDGTGNVIVTGESYRVGSSYDYATIKYSGAGVPLWTNRYPGPANGDNYAQAVAADSSGNVIVTGVSPGAGGDYDYASLKYSGAGVPLWTNRYDGPGNGDDYAYSLAVDTNGNVFVTGESFRSGSAYDYATIAYSSAGVPLWTNRYGGLGNGDDYANAVAVDSSGNAFVTGGSVGGGGGSDYATIKYSGAGVPLWTNRYNGPGNGNDYANAVVVDSSGNVFVTGASPGSGGDSDYATIAYSGAGVPLWTNRYSGPGNFDDGATAVAVGGGGNVFAAGYSWNGSNYDSVTIKYFSSVAAQAIPLAIQKVGNQVRLSWTNAAFGLQSAPALTGTFTNVPAATSPYTNPITGPQQFFRLIAN